MVSDLEDYSIVIKGYTKKKNTYSVIHLSNN